MKKFCWAFFSIFAAGVLLFGCKGSDGPTGAQGPAGPVLHGNLYGRVYLENEDHSRVTYISGVSVTVEGTAIAAVPDTNGNFVLKNVATGTWTVTAVKTGYGTSKQTNLQFVGGGDASMGNIWMEQMPSFDIQSLNPITTTTTTATISGTITNSVPYYRYVMVIFGKTSPVMSDPKSWTISYSGYIASSSNSFTVGIDTFSLRNGGFNSRDTVHVTVYSTGGNFDSGYYDVMTDNWVYTAIGANPKSSYFIRP